MFAIFTISMLFSVSVVVLWWWWLCVGDHEAVLMRFGWVVVDFFGLGFGVGTICGHELYKGLVGVV